MSSAQTSDTASSNWQRPAAKGYAIIILTFGVLGAWSAYARIDSAVVAPGVVAVDGSRKTIQHFEGGLISEILVKEGQHVKQGDILFRLDNTQSQANSDVLRNQLGASLALEARLIAERSESDRITFPDELEKSDRDVIKQAVADQQKQFAERQASLSGQIAILSARIQQYKTEISGLTLEREATERQLAFIVDELVGLHHLLDRNLVQKSRVLALEREKSRLEGVIGRSTADASKATNGISEAELQIKQLRQKFLEEVNANILETRQKVADLKEKIRVATDVLRRVDIRSPHTGEVQNVRVSTIGGVIRAGEPLLDLVPENEPLIVQAQVSPIDVEAVRAGMNAEVRFASFQTKVLPVIMGHVVSVSRDRLTDEHTKQPYFLARVVVEDREIPVEIRGRLSAGMPADIMVPTGERTVADYLLRPLENRFRKALRER
ncbi:MAG TPA: HlyD family type I secretion periplasmic adaptor subunit [Xanthobacteraceae bacterium]|nr:HlyD family type I secretion periplasmic adaptor subunit [Xanthobacteraceae bacterium]